MDIREFKEIARVAIKNTQEIQIDYEHIDGSERRVRTVAPFDVGLAGVDEPHRYEGNLYAFSADHYNQESNSYEPQVLVFSIQYIHAAEMLGEVFDPAECCATSLKHDSVDWSKKQYNLEPDREWF